MGLEQNILDVSKNYYKYLMNLKNVIGIGLGHKYINNTDIDEPCIHVLVENKVDFKYLPANNRIPKTYMGIKTDVIEIGKVAFNGGEAIPEKMRPLKGGCGISADAPPYVSGTLGCIVVKKVKNNKKESIKYYILGNNHVLANFNNNPIGTPIIQPSFFTIGQNTSKNKPIAKLTSFIQLGFTTDYNEPINFVDCAIAELYKSSLKSQKIIGIGKVKGLAENYNIGTLIKKVGFISGFTQGEILSIGVTINIKNKNEMTSLFKGQIIGNIESSPGDSGSIILDSKNMVIGLEFSAERDKNICIINDIFYVLDALNIELYTEFT